MARFNNSNRDLQHRGLSQGGIETMSTMSNGDGSSTESDDKTTITDTNNNNDANDLENCWSVPVRFDDNELDVNDSDSFYSTKSSIASNASSPGGPACVLSSEIRRRQQHIVSTIRKKTIDHENDVMEDEHILLADNIYSFIFLSKYKSASFVFAMVVFLFQMSIIVLTLVSIIDKDSSDNPLKVPPDVLTVTTIAQVFATLLVPFTMDDVLESLVKLQEGYQVFDNGIMDVCMYKWMLSVLLQFCAGSGLLIVIFILILQSETVIGMMLNFAALQFMSEIDNLAFKLAQNGFVAKTVRLETQKVANFKTKVSRKASNRFRRICFSVIVIFLMAGLAYVIGCQKSGKYLCQSIGIQFDDRLEPKIGTFSGVYDIMDNDYKFGRSAYIERRYKQALIAYCDKEKAWTFSIMNITDKSPHDPCRWDAKSDETSAFDVTATASSNWFIHSNKQDSAIPTADITLWCNDCEGSHAGDAGKCGGETNGQCINNECICYNDRFGLNCQYETPCESLAVDLRTDIFPFVGSSTSNEKPYQLLSEHKYDLLRYENNTMVIVYDHPVYVRHHNSRNTNTSQFHDVIVFEGRRWTLMTIHSYHLEKLKSKGNKYHFHYDKPVARNSRIFVTEAVNSFSTTSLEPTPAGLGWWEFRTMMSSSIDASLHISTQLLCSSCSNETNKCFNQGVCSADSECSCNVGFDGSLCEKEHYISCHLPSSLSSEENEGSNIFSNDTSYYWNKANRTGLCLNNGKCIPNEGSSDSGLGTCECPIGYYGNLCQMKMDSTILTLV